MKKENKQTIFRNFSNWNYYHETVIGCVLCVLWVLLCIVTCLLIHSEYGYEVNTYDEHNYEYLTEVVNNICDKNTKTLSIANIPDNVHITGGEFYSSKTDFKCVLEDNYLVISDPFVEVHISDNLDVEITHYTESEYIGDARATFVLFYVLWCLLCLWAIMAGWWLIKLVIYIFCILYDLIGLFITKIKSSNAKKDK